MIDRRSPASGDSRETGHAGEQPCAASASTNSAAGPGSTDGEFVEEALVDTSTPRTRASLSADRRLGVIDPRQPFKPALAEQRHMDGEGERAQAGIGADVARRLLAADVLLARRQRQHEAAPPLVVDGLAGEPPRHLPHIFVAGGEEPDIGAAEIQARCRSTVLRRPRCPRPARRGFDQCRATRSR